MARHTEKWWAEAQSIIYNYPDYKSEVIKSEYSLPAVNYDSTRPKNSIGNPVANEAIKIADDRRLQYMAQAIRAVDEAISTTSKVSSGDYIIKYIALRYWKKVGDHKFVSGLIPAHPNTCGRWNTSFVKLVGKNMGFF